MKVRVFWEIRMKASEMIIKLAQLINEHGDKKLWHEDNECNGCSLGDVVYCKEDDDFQVK